MLYSLVFDINRAEVRRYLGYQPGLTEDSERVDQLIEQTIIEVSRVAKPQGVICTYGLTEHLDGGRQVAGTELVLTAPDLQVLLQHSAKVSFLAVTLGSDVDLLINDLLQQGHYAAAAIADAVGSAGAEQAIRELQGSLEREANLDGLCLTERFSPGYGDVPLTLQTDLVYLLGAERIGVSVTASLLLLPRKSITATVGWQTVHDSSVNREKCLSCVAINCHFRPQGAAPSESR